MIARLRTLACTLALAATATLAQPAQDVAFEQRLKRLEGDLRCLVCQNQTLADSNAPLAEDLRREVRSLALAGKSDAEIRAFLVARYGDFVLYNPPVKESTWLLWFGPFALLAAGAVIWLGVIRRRQRAGHAPSSTPPVSAEASARARDVIEGKSSG